MKPFPVFEKVDIAIERALGCFVYDKQQQAYLDLYGGHAVISVGHSHPHVVEETIQQMNKIGFYSNAVTNDLQDRLAERLGSACGYPTYAVFYSNSGAEANENALKLASFHTGRRKVLAMSNAFHGRTAAAVSATDIRSIRAPLNDSEQFVFTPFNEISSLKKQLETEEYCAVIIEPIQGVLELIQDGTIRRHIRKATLLYKKKRDFMIAQVDKYLQDHVSYTSPQGGLAVWLSFKHQIDWAFLSQKLKERSVHIPHPENYSRENIFGGIRLGYGSLSEELIEEGIIILAELLEQAKRSFR